MQPGPVTAPARLAALVAQDILDTPPDEAFDGIVRLATRLCAAPIGLVSLVAADRQWFKARLNFSRCETDLDSSVCKFALDGPDLLVIPDLAADGRTAANPLVTGEPFVRFYAGAPLRLPGGAVLGSLCVLDTAPRPGGLTPEQGEDLSALAAQVVARMELRRALAERDRLIDLQRGELRRRQRLDALAEASTVLAAADDPAAALALLLAGGADRLGFDAAVLHGVTPGGRHLGLAQAVGVPSEARARLDGLAFGAPPFGTVAETRRPLILAGLRDGADPRGAGLAGLGWNGYAGYPVVSRGELCGVLSFASAGAEPFDGEAVTFFETLARLMAAAFDRLDAEAALAEVGAYWRSLFERLSEGFLVGELVRDGAGRATDWRYVEVNRAWGDLVGVDARAAQGRTVREVFPGVEDAWVDEFARVVDTGEPATFLRRVGDLDRWYDGRAFSLGADRFAVLFLEATERVAAEARRDAQLALGDRLSQLTTPSEMTRAASEIVATTLGATRASFGRVDPDIAHVDVEPGWTAPGVGSIAGRHRFADYGDIRADLRRGEPLVVHDVRADPRTRGAPGPLLDIGVGALVNVPVRDRGRTVAVLIVHDDKPHRWSPEVLAFLRNVADRVEAGAARVRAEEDQRLLNEEMAHRLKNTMAMVLSIAAQTLRDVPERAPVEAFEQRLHALSAAHDVLLRRTWTAAPMEDVVSAVLAAAGHADRVAAAGPHIDLAPRAALSVSLLLHELTTNAAKYGGLSAADGRVDVAWRVEGEGGERAVVLDWAERGGPAPVAPARSKRAGFGSRLIRMGLAGSGGVDLRYPPSGFEATLRAPLAQLQDG